MCKHRGNGESNAENESDTTDESSDDTNLSDSDNSNSDNVETCNEEIELPTTSCNKNENEENKDDSDDDEVVKAIKKQLEKVRHHPPDIRSDDLIVDISFHPKNNIIASATVTGDVILYKYTNENIETVKTLELHTKACRDIEFSKDGNTIYSSSKDKSITLSDVNTGKLKIFYDNAHEEPIHTLLVVDDNIFATGDDNGTVKLWDVRKRDHLWSVKEMEDYVSCIITTERQKYLVCSSGEGSITSLDLGMRRLHIQSEMYEADFTCMATIRSETKLLVGSSNGSLYIFNWGEFGYHSDEFSVKDSISCLIPITENIVVCGGEDGILRATHFFPQRHLGIVGQHQFAVESLDISNDGQFIASSSHDQTIKFWNINYCENIQIDDRTKAKKKEMNHNLPSSKSTNVADFFQDLI